MTEQWRDIPEWTGLYQVSDLGRVRSLHPNSRSKGELRTFRTTNGYRAVNLSGGGVRRLLLIHRLVLQAFVGPIPEGMHGSHLDGCKDNNHLTNLRIETPSQNCRRRGEHGTQARNKTNTKVSKEDADAMRALASGGWKQLDIASKFGITQSNVSRILSGQTWR